MQKLIAFVAYKFKKCRVMNVLGCPGAKQCKYYH